MLGVDVVDQTIKTEDLDDYSQEYLACPTSPETEVKTKEVIVSEMLDQRINTGLKHFIERKFGGENKFICDSSSAASSQLTQTSTSHRLARWN